MNNSRKRREAEAPRPFGRRLTCPLLLKRSRRVFAAGLRLNGTVAGCIFVVHCGPIPLPIAIMSDVEKKDVFELRTGDQLTAEVELRRGDSVWLDRFGEHDVKIRRVSGDAPSPPGTPVYVADRDPASGALALRLAPDAPGAALAVVPDEVLESYLPFFRDTALPAAALNAYRAGQTLWEPAFCDTSWKFGGFVAPHRYVIFSASARALPDPRAEAWGLSLWPHGRLFRVIGVLHAGAQSQIALLDVHEGFAATCSDAEREALSQKLAAFAQHLFEQAREAAPVAELNQDEWRKRLVDPVGINEDGVPFPLPVSL